MKNKLIAFLVLLLMWGGSSFASPSSTNYGISNFIQSGGGGDTTSTNYQIKEGRIVLGETLSLSSTNYEIEAVEVSITGRLATVDSVTPGDLSPIYYEDNISYTVTATDPDGDTLQYAAEQDATSKVTTQSSNVLPWTLTVTDFGRHTANLDVIDPDGTVTRQQDFFVVHTPAK